MPYATQQNLIDRFSNAELVQITNQHDGTATTINVTTLNQAIADADADINGYLAGRYELPLASVPPVLVRVACDIARYYLYADMVTTTVQKRYDDAVSYLEQLARGTIKLSLDTTGAEAPDDVMIEFSSSETVFGR